MPPTSANYEMADRLAGGQLGRILQERRAAKQSFQAIARGLYADFGVNISVQTVSNWLDVLEAETPKPKAKAS